MQHFTEEQLVEHYYGESVDPEFDRHLHSCPTCSREYAALQRDLAEVPSITPPVRSEAYGGAVWQRIRPSLQPYPAPKPRWFRGRLGTPAWGPLVWATACALLLAAGFVGGRYREHRRPELAVNGNAQARQRVVVLVLGDHLDRSERLLVELNHATGESGAASPIQGEARELLAANRLVRQSASLAGDGKLEASLDRLERLLVEIANQPGDLSAADLDSFRRQMNTPGLLFDIRVLRSRINEQQPGTTEKWKGVSAL